MRTLFIAALTLLLTSLPAQAQEAPRAGLKVSASHVCFGTPDNIQAVVDAHKEHGQELASEMFGALLQTGACAMANGRAVILLGPAGDIVSIGELGLQVWKVRAAESETAVGFLVLNIKAGDL